MASRTEPGGAREVGPDEDTPRCAQDGAEASAETMQTTGDDGTCAGSGCGCHAATGAEGLALGLALALGLRRRRG